MHLTAIIASCFLVPQVAVSAAPLSEASVAILPFSAADSSLATTIEPFVIGAVGAYGSGRLVEPADVRAAGIAAPCAVPACAVAAGAELAVDYVIIGQLGELDDALSISLRLVRTADGEVVATGRETSTAGRHQVVQAAVDQLFGAKSATPAADSETRWNSAIDLSGQYYSYSSYLEPLDLNFTAGLRYREALVGAHSWTLYAGAHLFIGNQVLGLGAQAVMLFGAEASMGVERFFGPPVGFFAELGTGVSTMIDPDVGGIASTWLRLSPTLGVRAIIADGASVSLGITLLLDLGEQANVSIVPGLAGGMVF